METKKDECREIIQSYILTTARYDFSIDEKRILAKVITSLQPLLEGKHLNGKIERYNNKDYGITMPIKDFVSEGENYMRVKKALKRLADKGIEYETADEWWYTHLFKAVGTNTKGLAKIEIDDRILDAFLDFSKGYSKYELETTLSFNSIYTMRMYELMSSQTKEITYSIEKLKEMFKVSDKYRLNADFIRRVIIPAQRELDEKSPVSFTYTPLKQGKKITSIRFCPKRFRNRGIDVQVETAELKRQLGALQVIGDKPVVNYLKYTCNFSERELTNNYKLIKSAIRLFGDDIDQILRDLYRKSTEDGIKDSKAYMIGSLKKKCSDAMTD